MSNMNDKTCIDALQEARELIAQATRLQKQGKFVQGKLKQFPRITMGDISGTSTIIIGCMDKDLAENLLNEIDDKVNEAYIESAKRRMNMAADLSKDVLIHTSLRADGKADQE